MIIVNEAGLLGDSLCGFGLIEYIAKQEGMQGIPLYVLLRHKGVREIIPQTMESNIKIINDLEDLWDLHPGILRHDFLKLDAGKGMAASYNPDGSNLHMLQSHFRVHNYPVPTSVITPKLKWYYDWEWQGDIDDSGKVTCPVYDYIISPFSRSDDHNNKLWPYERWQEVINYLNSHNYTVAVLGVSKYDPRQLFTGVDYIFDYSLPQVCDLISHVRKAMLTIDNGISHLTHFLKKPHVLLYPSCLATEWVSNFNDNAIIHKDRPLDISVDKVIEMIHQVQQFTEQTI